MECYFSLHNRRAVGKIVGNLSQKNLSRHCWCSLQNRRDFCVFQGNRGESGASAKRELRAWGGGGGSLKNHACFAGYCRWAQELFREIWNCFGFKFTVNFGEVFCVASNCTTNSKSKAVSLSSSPRIQNVKENGLQKWKENALRADHFTFFGGEGGGWFWKKYILQVHKRKKKIPAQDHRPKNFTHVQWAGKKFWQDVPCAETLNFCISKLLKDFCRRLASGNPWHTMCSSLLLLPGLTACQSSSVPCFTHKYFNPSSWCAQLLDIRLCRHFLDRQHQARRPPEEQCHPEIPPHPRHHNHHPNPLHHRHHNQPKPHHRHHPHHHHHPHSLHKHFRHQCHHHHPCYH